MIPTLGVLRVQQPAIGFWVLKQGVVFFRLSPWQPLPLDQLWGWNAYCLALFDFQRQPLDRLPMPSDSRWAWISPGMTLPCVIVRHQPEELPWSWS
jgi:hypothetical protein